MADDIHLSKLKQEGVDTWNKWREDNPDIVPCLNGADLHGLNLRHGNLRQIDFGKANLFDADLCGADLEGVDLSATEGLLTTKLAGADLTGARVPENIRVYEKLDMVREISDNAKKLFLALLAGCLYSALTIATTQDVELITNRASSPLPIIQTAIPIIGFYVIAPVILLCIYIYFHFYLQKLWEELASLPAIFPDGRPLHTCADPWLLNDLVRAHLDRLRAYQSYSSRLPFLQKWVSIALAWWVVPGILCLFWGRFLPSHELFWTSWHVVILGLSVVAAVSLYRLACQTLQMSNRPSLRNGNRPRFPKLKRAFLVTLPFIVLGFISIGATARIQLWPPMSPKIYHSPSGWSWNIKLGRLPFADLRGSEISVKPHDWVGKRDDEFDHVQGAKLEGSNLRYAAAYGSFCAKTSLAGSDLRGADFTDSDLRQANLEHASLDGINLHSALLSSAKFVGATMIAANLAYADLSKADLTGDTKLANANLIHTRLEEADLRGADLNGATFEQTQVAYANLENAKGLTADIVKNGFKDWDKAFFDENMLRDLGLSENHNKQLCEAENAPEHAKNRFCKPE